jgi:NAD(P)-dependent dehydrogenase (short-subunit alcohol dehydrogenase family)
MKTDYKDKVAFITGAGSGIGRATALAFAREGSKVVIADYSEAGSQETLKQIKDSGGEAIITRCDVRSEEDIKRALDETIKAYGRLDFAFNNAGSEQKAGAIADTSVDEWDRIMNINLRGVFLCMKYQLPLLLKQGGGVIVNTSSGAGVMGIKNGGAYTASKHGVIGLTKSAALDYAAFNIRVNAVCPGYIDTSMMDRFTGATKEGREQVISEEPVGRMGRPEEIAATVLWLCSDLAAFVVGHALVVDGGQTV